MDFRDIKEFIKDTFGYVVVIVVVLLINLYIIAFQQIIGPSMQNNLETGNIVIVNKIIYKFIEPRRCDVISFENEDKMLVKRVIGLPGDHIEYKDNYLYINGTKYEEPYLSDVVTKDFKLEDLPGNYSVIPEDMYLVLGDNRVDSMDSRDFGLINKSSIKGKVSIRIWPISGLKLVK